MNGEGFSRQEVRWSGAEKKIARSAFDKAYQNQCATILAKATKMLAAASVPRDLWKVYDYLSVQRRATDKTYDYRYSVLLSVFAALIEENWLNVTDLAGLQESKIEKIEAWVKFRRDDRG